MLDLTVDDGLRLAPLTLHHADAFFALTDANRAHLRPWLGWVDATQTVEDVRALLQVFLNLADAGTGEAAGIWLHDRLVGTVDVHDLSPAHASVGLGYWIGGAHQGHGLVTRCCRAVLRAAFEDWALHRVEIRCPPANHRSRAVAERLGFTLEGQVRQAYALNGRYEDLVVYGLLAPEWRAAR